MRTPSRSTNDAGDDQRGRRDIRARIEQALAHAIDAAQAQLSRESAAASDEVDLRQHGVLAARTRASLMRRALTEVIAPLARTLPAAVTESRCALSPARV